MAVISRQQHGYRKILSGGDDPPFAIFWRKDILDSRRGNIV
jgi:hypothetical protein